MTCFSYIIKKELKKTNEIDSIENIIYIFIPIEFYIKKILTFWFVMSFDSFLIY